MTKSVLFVCLGNICRSPSAEAVFAKLAAGRNLRIDSAGTSGWHDGKPSDLRASKQAAVRGFDMSMIRSRKVSEQDFFDFDLIIAMDRQNLRDLREIEPEGSRARIELLLSYAPELGRDDVPDPYFEDNFPEVLEMLEAACKALLAQI